MSGSYYSKRYDNYPFLGKQVKHIFEEKHII